MSYCECNTRIWLDVVNPAALLLKSKACGYETLSVFIEKEMLLRRALDCCGLCASHIEADFYLLVHRCTYTL